MKRDRKGEETGRDTLIQNVRQHKNLCVRVCVYEEFLNSDTCMYTQWRSCAFRFIVVSASWHTPPQPHVQYLIVLCSSVL